MLACFGDGNDADHEKYSFSCALITSFPINGDGFVLNSYLKL